MTEQEKKHALRREMLKKRAALTQEYIKNTETSSIPTIIDFLKNTADSAENDAKPYSDGGACIQRKFTVMSYMSYKNEFPTHKLNEKIIENGWRLVLPYTDSDFKITACIAESYDDLAISPLGIPEPSPSLCAVAEINDIDVVLMPGVAFDMRGNRTGFGKGCYDRFLADSSSAAPRLPLLAALAYNFQITDEVPYEPTDVPCDVIITEDRVIFTSAAQNH